MSSLPLVIDIVDLIDEAGEHERALDVEAEAKRLLEGHPEADASKEQIVEVIRSEEVVAGLRCDS